jgi:hypothetical protein
MFTPQQCLRKQESDGLRGGSCHGDLPQSSSYSWLLSKILSGTVGSVNEKMMLNCRNFEKV